MSHTVRIICTALFTLMSPAALTAQAAPSTSTRPLLGEWTWVTEFQGYQSHGTLTVARSDTTYIGTGTQATANGPIGIRLVSGTMHDSTVNLRIATQGGIMPIEGIFRGDSIIAGTWTNEEGNRGTFTLTRIPFRRP